MGSIGAEILARSLYTGVILQISRLDQLTKIKTTDITVFNDNAE